jgi:hypothetical protein
MIRTILLIAQPNLLGWTPLNTGIIKLVLMRSSPVLFCLLSHCSEKNSLQVLGLNNSLSMLKYKISHSYTATARSKAGTVFARSNTEIVGSNPT